MLFLRLGCQLGSYGMEHAGLQGGGCIGGKTITYSTVQGTTSIPSEWAVSTIVWLTNGM